MTASRYFPESDGDSHCKTYYVKNTTSLFRQDCASWSEAKKLAEKLNKELSHEKDHTARDIGNA